MAALIQEAIDFGLNYYRAIIDPRVAEWPLMESPIPTVLMVASYLYIILYAGPQYMENRKPFKLKNVLIIYNAAQVIFSAYMLWEHLMSGWLLDYNYACQPIDYSYSPKPMRMVHLCWWYYISKLTEFLDTIFFIMRKKDNQVTFLHLYHHSLTPFESWICVKFLAGGHGTFSNLINNMVHVIMYFYYMMSALGPEYQKYLWWKKYLTTIQLTQFALVFIHSLQIFIYDDCNYPKIVAGFLLVHSIVFFALFWNFYQKAYKIEEMKMKNLITNTTNSQKITNLKQHQNNIELLTPAAEGPITISTLSTITSAKKRQ